MKRLILAGMLALSCALPAIANPVTQIGVDNSYPTSSSNPFPVVLSGSSSGTTQNVNVKQINGVAPSMGNGVSGTGVQRVTIASDSTGVISLQIAGAAVSATNGLYFNQLQGNAVTSATNGGFQNMLFGNVAVSQTNPLPTTQSTLATASIVNSAVDIVTTTSTVVSLGVTSRKISVKNCDATAVINVDIKAGTASVSNGVRLDPGISYTFTPAVGASSFSYYSTAPTSATKTLTYVAENKHKEEAITAYLGLMPTAFEQTAEAL